MAIPDPHMEEMSFMTYEPKPRSCKKMEPIPRRQEYIEVMWCLDYLPGLPERWCTAEVLHVGRSPAQDIIAEGVIRYLPDHAWNEEIHEVEFLEQHGIRRIQENTEERETDNSSNENPVTKWRSACRPSEDSAPSEDEEWIVDKTQKDRRYPNISTTLTKPGDDHLYEIQSLRSAYAVLVVEVEKIKKELISQSHTMSELRKKEIDMETCSSAGCVLERLRHKIALRLQGGLRSTPSNRLGKRPASDKGQIVEVRTGDGVQVGVLKARVECTLRQFESVARHIHMNTGPDRVVFIPEFSHTQLPSPCSAAFRVLFKTFNDLAAQIGITSISDRLEMARKCGSGIRGDILRILGTYSFDKNDPCSAANIYFGTSCGNGIEKDTEPSNENPGQVENKYPVLARSSRSWDLVDHRFSQPIRLKYTQLPALDGQASDVQSFSITWKRASELGPRIWSNAITDSKTVFGWLELGFPYIQVEGKYLCSEIGAMVGDDEWEALFSK